MRGWMLNTVDVLYDVTHWVCGQKLVWHQHKSGLPNVGALTSVLVQSEKLSEYYTYCQININVLRALPSTGFTYI